MALNNSHKSIIADRRQVVARLVLRQLTQREIQDALTEQGIVADDGKPWSLGTVNSDIKALNAEWKKRAASDIDNMKAQQLAELAEVKRQGWADNDTSSVLRALSLEMDITGTRAAAKNEVTGAAGGPVTIRVVYDEKLPSGNDNAES